MSKVLKDVASVIVIAGATALGEFFGGPVGAAAAFVATTAIALKTHMLDLRPSPSGGSQTKWKADAYAPLPYLIGRTLSSGYIVYKRGHGPKNKFETMVTVLCCAGPIQSIDTTFANKTTVAFDGSGNATGTYAGRIYQASQLGQTPEPAALVPPIGSPTDWNAACKLSGLAAIMTTLVYDGTGTKTLTTEPQMAWIGHWVKVYDPRLDDTYPGGAGACRAYDETTYVWSENPHLHALTWTMGRFANGKRIIGIGGTAREIDVASFVEGANLDDARHWTIGGQVLSRPDTPWNSLKSMLQAGGAMPVLVGGVISCVNQAPRVSLATITSADIVGDCTFAGTQPKRTRLNGIIPNYRSEAHDWEMVAAAGVIVPDYVAIDGDERTKEISYNLVQDVNQVAQLAAYDICNGREAGPGNVPLKPAWLNYRIGDCVTFNPEPTLSIKCIISGRALDPQSGVVTYTLSGETDAKHAFALGQTGIAPPIATIVYDDSTTAPASSSWSVTSTAMTAGAASTPALVVSGTTSDNPSASDIIFELRSHVAGQADDVGWHGVSTEPAYITRKLIPGVAVGGVYDVGIRYRMRGQVGDRLILSSITAGALSDGTTSLAIS